MPLALKTLFVGLTGVFFGAHIALAAASDISINEVYYDPEGSDTGKEFIELYNAGDETIDLTGWDLDPSSAPYVTLSNISIQAQTYLTIYINAEGTNDSKTFYTGELSNMSNTKGPVALFDASEHTAEHLIDYIAYGEGGQTNESKAVKKDLWKEGNYIPDVPEGKSIALIYNTWLEAIPTPGGENSAIETQKEILKEKIDEEIIILPETEKPPLATLQKIEPIKIKNKPHNEPPEIFTTIPLIVKKQTTIHLDASESRDDGEIESYIWEFGNGDALTGIQTSYAYKHAGSYFITLTISDGELKTQQSFPITVTETIDEVPLTNEEVINEQFIIVSELMPNPEGSDAEGEWVELFNNSTRIFDLSGWKLDDKEGGSKPYTFKDGTVIDGGDYLVIDREETGIAFNNTVDMVRLLTPDGTPYFSVAYTGVKEGVSLLYSNGELVLSHESTPGSTTTSTQLSNTINVRTPQSANVANSNSGAITIEGVVTAPPNLFAKRYFYIQLLDTYRNPTEHGMQVYMHIPNFPKLEAGDIIALSGSISLTGVEPKIIINNQQDIYEQHEVAAIESVNFAIAELTDKQLGSLITVDGTFIDREGSTTTLINSGDEIRVYIPSSVQISMKDFPLGSSYSVTGILSKTSSGFRLLPRFTSDIVSINVAGASTITEKKQITSSQVNLIPYLLTLLILLVTIAIIIQITLYKRQRHKINKIHIH